MTDREQLHRDGFALLRRAIPAEWLGDIVNALAYFDDYGPENGATRLLPGSHRPDQEAPPFDFNDESRSVQLSGSVGDILVFDVDLVHAGSLNSIGARRRSILISYFAETLYASHPETVSLRSIRMDTTDRFDPSDFTCSSGSQIFSPSKASKISTSK